jgi:hypothetical protein
MAGLLMNAAQELPTGTLAPPAGLCADAAVLSFEGDVWPAASYRFRITTLRDFA